MGIVVIGAAFMDIKGFPQDNYIPTGRNVGRVEYIHGGVARNVVEDIANVELRPTYVGIVDDTPMGDAVVKKLRNHKVNCDYVLTIPDGMGTWLAVFDNNGDVAGSISKRPNMLPVVDLLEEKGDEIFAAADSVVLECDLDKVLVKKVLELAKKHGKKIFALVSNISLAIERRDLLKQFDCFICNKLEAGMFFIDDYTDKTREEMRDILAEKVMQAKIPAMVVTLGGDGAVYADVKGAGQGYHRRGRRLLRGRGDRPDLRQDAARGDRDRLAAGSVGHHFERKRLPEIPAQGAGSGYRSAALSDIKRP